MEDRALDWDGCVNVRDLGGLPTEDGGTTRRGAVVRGDNARRLTDAGWEALVGHGIRRVVDLRWEEEQAEDPPRELPIEAVHVSLLGDYDAAWTAALDERVEELPDAERVREVYLAFLDRRPDQFVAAIAAVADAPEGGVMLHCAVGKDRTGLIAAMLLRLAGVPDEQIAEDYAVSAENLRDLHQAWLDEAEDEVERARRRRLQVTPREAILSVLAELDRRHGGVRGYLRAAGATPEQLDRVRERLRG